MSLGPVEIVILVAIAAVVFGPSMFVRAGKSLGQGIKSFKSAVDDSNADKEDETEEEEER